LQKPHHWPRHLTSYKKHWDFEPINKGHPFNIALSKEYLIMIMFHGIGWGKVLTSVGWVFVFVLGII
jgi:hypothetical protein